MEVCGVDPGLGTCGYAVLSIDGESTVVRDAGVFRTDGREPLPARLVQIEADFSSVIEQHQPNRSPGIAVLPMCSIGPISHWLIASTIAPLSCSNLLGQEGS